MVETFCDYMRTFIVDRNIRTIAEIGTDFAFQRPIQLAPYCEQYFSVNFPEDCTRLEEKLDLYKDATGKTNVTLISGNAIELSNLIKPVDLILLHGVLLDFTGNDTELMFQYSRGEKPYTEEDRITLATRFTEARIKTYLECIKVARYIVTFNRPKSKAIFDDIIQNIKIPTEKIQKVALRHGECEEIWDLHTISV